MPPAHGQHWPGPQAGDHTVPQIPLPPGSAPSSGTGDDHGTDPDQGGDHHDDTPGNGSGTGTGSDTGTGDDHHDDTGSGDGHDDHHDDTGAGSGDNTGTGSGNGTGDNTGTGTGNGTGDNTGNGSGTGTGSGDNTGTGTGNGTGTGDNTGTGDDHHDDTPGNGNGTGEDPTGDDGHEHGDHHPPPTTGDYAPGDPPVPDNPRWLATVTGDWIVGQLSEFGFHNAEPIMLDTNYAAVSESYWNTVFASAQGKDFPYVVDYRDDDDFALYLRGFSSMYYGLNGIGVVVDYASRHAYNIVLVNNNGYIGFRLVVPYWTGDVTHQWVPADQLGQAPYTLAPGTVIIW